jgi:hypothetical protein
MPARFELTTEVTLGDWIAPRLAGAFGAVGLVCPTGFDAYARVFHPVGERRLRWAEVCATTGRIAHPLMQWGRISGTLHGTRYFGDWQGGEPDEGALDVGSLATLAGTIGADAIGADTAITIGVWNGYGQLHPGATSSFALSYVADDGTPPAPVAADREGYQATFAVEAATSPTLATPGREYLLFRGALSTLRDPHWREASGWAWRWSETLNLAWPDDRSWFVASEIDFDSTIVGGSRALIDRVLASGLETVEVGPASDLSWEGDLINPLG